MDLGKVETELKSVPWWAWGLIGGGVLFVVVKGRQGSPSQAIQSDGSLPDGAKLYDLAGIPFGSDLTSNPFDYSTPPDGTTVDTGAPTSTPAPSPSPTPPPSGGPAIPPTRPPIGDLPTGTPTGTPSPRPHEYHTFHAWPAWDSTLSGVAQHYGESWQELYNMGNNKQIIDSTAHAHGHYTQEYDWVFPGETIEVR